MAVRLFFFGETESRLSALLVMGCGTSQVEIVANGEGPVFERDGTNMSTAGLVPGRETSFMSPGDMQNLATQVNRKRRPLPPVSHSPGIVLSTPTLLKHLANKDAYRYNAILNNIPTIFNYDGKCSLRQRFAMQHSTRTYCFTQRLKY